jgi:hypothetical protein
MFIKKIQNNKVALLILFLGFIGSCLLSINNISKYDKNIKNPNNNIFYHQMIKTDAYRYLSQGSEIKDQIKKGANFFETGPENYTKYLPSRLAALYYYFFDINLFDNSIDKKIKTGIHLNYLLIQCFFYFFCLTLLYFSLIEIISKKISFIILLFLCFEPTIFQYHASFWSESIFFSLQILLISIILKKNDKISNFFLIGFFLGILSLQKEYSIFYIIVIIIYFIFTSNFKYKKIYLLLIGFFSVQLFLAFNNYKRSGDFYIMSADSKVNLHRDLVEKVMHEKYKISQKEFAIIEGKETFKWLINNSIKFDKKKIINIQKPEYMEVRDSIISEKDKVKFDDNIRNRTVNYLANYPLDFSKFIFKSSIHIILLNPFHIWSDNNYISGEYYYTTETHKKLIPYRIIYSLTIYSICLLGILSIIKKKEYNILLYLVLSIIYFYSLVSWHGNTRYFVPVMIYLSFFFGYGLDKIINLKKR